MLCNLNSVVRNGWDKVEKADVAGSGCIPYVPAAALTSPKLRWARRRSVRGAVKRSHHTTIQQSYKCWITKVVRLLGLRCPFLGALAVAEGKAVNMPRVARMRSCTEDPLRPLTRVRAMTDILSALTLQAKVVIRLTRHANGKVPWSTRCPLLRWAFRQPILDGYYDSYPSKDSAEKLVNIVSHSLSASEGCAVVTYLLLVNI